MSCPSQGSIERFVRRTVCTRGPRQVHDGFGGIVRVEDHPEPVFVVRRVARRLGRNDRLDVGGLEDLLETQRHARCYRSDGRSSPPRIEPPSGRLFWGRFWGFFKMLARFYPPMIAASWGNRPASNVPPGVSGRLALPSPGAAQVPTGAKVAFVDVQADARLQLLDICRSQRLLLGAKYRFGGSICPPVRSKGQRSILAPSSTGAPGWAVSATHRLHLAWKRPSCLHQRGSFAISAGPRTAKGPDAP
jgi:hypothetical protein